MTDNSSDSPRDDARSESARTLLGATQIHKRFGENEVL